MVQKNTSEHQQLPGFSKKVLSDRQAGAVSDDSALSAYLQQGNCCLLAVLEARRQTVREREGEGYVCERENERERGGPLPVFLLNCLPLSLQCYLSIQSL